MNPIGYLLLLLLATACHAHTIAYRGGASYPTEEYREYPPTTTVPGVPPELGDGDETVIPFRVGVFTIESDQPEPQLVGGNAYKILSEMAYAPMDEEPTEVDENQSSVLQMLMQMRIVMSVTVLVVALGAWKLNSLFLS